MSNGKPLTGLRRAYKVFRWGVLATLIVMVCLVFKRPSHAPEAPDPLKVPEQAREFEGKLQQLEEAGNRGDSGTQVEFSALEVNSFLAQSMARQGAHAGVATPVGPNLPAPQIPAPPIPGTTSNAADSNNDPGTVRDFRMDFKDDEIVGYFTVDFHGKDLEITVSGRPGSSNGYLTFAPTGFKVGSLPVPVSLVDPALQKKLNEPETREKLRLPAFIGDLRVQNGQIVITQK